MSADGTKLAYSLQAGGAEIGTMHVIDVASGRELVYLCGHSLGAHPVLASEYVEDVMRDWR